MQRSLRMTARRAQTSPLDFRRAPRSQSRLISSRLKKLPNTPAPRLALAQVRTAL